MQLEDIRFHALPPEEIRDLTTDDMIDDPTVTTKAI